MHLDRKTIELTKTKNGYQRTVHLNADAIAAIESRKVPGHRMKGRLFPREGSKDRFDNRSWFVPCLKEAKIDGYLWHSNRHSFCSWLAMAGASRRKSRKQPVTAGSRCQPAIRTCHPLIACPSSSGSPQGTNMHPYMHLGINRYRSKEATDT